MTRSFMDGMAGIFVDVFAPVDDVAGTLHAFQFYRPTVDGDYIAFAEAEAIFHATFSETKPARADAPVSVEATYPVLVVSLEDYPEFEAVQRGWRVRMADRSLMEIGPHTDLLNGAMRRFRLKRI